MQVALISDTHIATDPDALCYYQKPALNLEKVVSQILELAPAPQAILHAGDVAFMSGQPGDYLAACGILEPLGRRRIPIHYLMGNHDQLKYLSGTMAPDVMSPLVGTHMSTVTTGPVTWLTINTPIRCGEVTGQVSHATMQWVADQIDLEPDQSFIVMGHHHPNDSFRSDVADNKGLTNSEEFIEFLDSHPRLRAYVFGHTHAWWNGQTPGGTSLINLPATSWSFDEVRPHGWVLADIAEDEVRLTLRCLEHGHPQEGNTVSIPLPEPALV